MSTWTKQAPSGAIVEQSGSWAYFGGAGTVGNMSDASDSSGIKKSSLNAGDYDYVVFPITTPTIPTNEVFLQSRFRVRMSRPANGVVAVALGYYVQQLVPGFIPPRYISISSYLTPTYYSGSLAASDVVGSWTPTLATLVKVFDRTGVLARISSFLEVWCDYQTASLPQKPTVITSGTFIDTAAPTLSWTHIDQLAVAVTNKALTSNVATLTTVAPHGFQVGNDVTVTISDAAFDGTYKVTAVTSTTFSYARTNANVTSTGASGAVLFGDGLTQQAYQAKVYSAAQYGAGGFSPDTSAATYDSGIGSGSTNSLGGVVNLANATYRLYVRTGKTVNGATYWSPWGFNTFTVNVPVPAVALTATWDSANQRTTLAVVGSGNLLSAQDAQMETAATTGGWTAQTNCTVTQSSTFADSGTGSLRLSSTAAGNMSTITATGLAGVPVTGSQAYSATARLRAGSVARTNTVGITWYDSAGGVISTTTGSGVASTTSGFTTVTVTGTSPANAAFAAVVVTVQATAAGAELHYVDTIAVHPGSSPNFTPGGLTWTVTLTRSTAGVVETVRQLTALPTSQVATFYDYEPRRGIVVTYAVTLSGTNATATVTSTSATVTSGVTTTNDGTWWAKAVTSPTLNRGAVRVLADPSESREENLGVFRLDGRSDVVVVAGQTFGDDIEFTVHAGSAAEWEAVKALFIAYQGTILLQEPFTDSAGVGIQRWIRVVDRTWDRGGVVAAPRRIVRCRAVEVGKGY